MSEDPISPQSPTGDSVEPEWTDDIEPSSGDQAAAAEGAMDEVPTDEWDDNLDWEDLSADVSQPQEKQPSAGEAIAWLSPLWRRGLMLWQRLLAGVRARVPATSDLSNGVLSAILVGVLVILLIVLNALRSPSKVSAPVVQSPEPASPSVTAAPTVPADTPEPPAIERDRIAAIQAELIEGNLIANNSLVESIETDFQHQQLSIQLSSDWYRLSADEQNDLANSLMGRVLQVTDFDRFQLQSPEGILLARPPVVGNNMVVLERAKPLTVAPPPRPRYQVIVD